MMIGGGILFGTLGTWLTPPWLLGVGAAVGLCILVVGYFIAVATSQTAANFLHDALREGFLRPVLILAAILAAIGLVSSPVVPVKDLLRSITRLPRAGSLDVNETIAPKSDDPKAPEQQVSLDIRPAELKTLHIVSDKDVKISLMQYGIIKQAQQGHDRNHRRRALRLVESYERKQSVLWRLDRFVGDEHPQFEQRAGPFAIHRPDHRRVSGSAGRAADGRGAGRPRAAVSVVQSGGAEDRGGGAGHGPRGDRSAAVSDRGRRRRHSRCWWSSTFPATRSAKT